MGELAASLGPGWGRGAFLGLDCHCLPCVALGRAEHTRGAQVPNQAAWFHFPEESIPETLSLRGGGAPSSSSLRTQNASVPIHLLSLPMPSEASLCWQLYLRSPASVFPLCSLGGGDAPCVVQLGVGQALAAGHLPPPQLPPRPALMSWTRALMERKESLAEGSLIRPDLIRSSCEIGGTRECPMHQE